MCKSHFIRRKILKCPQVSTIFKNKSNSPHEKCRLEHEIGGKSQGKCLFCEIFKAVLQIFKAFLQKEILFAEFQVFWTTPGEHWSFQQIWMLPIFEIFSVINEGDSQQPFYANPP